MVSIQTKGTSHIFRKYHGVVFLITDPNQDILLSTPNYTENASTGTTIQIDFGQKFKRKISDFFRYYQMIVYRKRKKYRYFGMKTGTKLQNYNKKIMFFGITV